MFLHIEHVTYLHEYKIQVTFNNGRTGTADLRSVLTGTMFEPLKDTSVFAQLTIDPDLETIVWPNGADLAPEFLYYQAFKDDPELQGQFQQWGYIPSQDQKNSPKKTVKTRAMQGNTPQKKRQTARREKVRT